MRELDEMPLEEIEKEEEQKGVFGRQDYRLVQFILGNDEVEHELKMFLVKHLWAFKDREMALTNFDNLDVQRERLMFHDAVLSFLMSRPHYQFNFSDEMAITNYRSEEHTSELQSQSNLVCRLLLEKT